MFRNKHVVIALLVAPMLAIMAWFAVDYFVAEQPQAITPGASYPLVAKPNCRRLSERCELANADFRLTLAAMRFDASGVELELTSMFPLEAAAVGIANADEDDGPPTALQPEDAEDLDWRGQIDGRIDAESVLRVVVRANEATFYAEVPVTFFYGED